MEDHSIASSQHRVLVVGAGLGGIKAALDLAEAGRDVILLDKAQSIGGLMTHLDRTFPTNNCDLCTISSHLAESGRNLHIELLPLSRIEALEGDVGDFKVTVRQAPRFIDLDACTACGDCLRAFPECITFRPGLDHRAPTCMRYPQATPYAFAISMDACKAPEALVKVCPVGAILRHDEDRMLEVRVGAIVLAPGAELFQADLLTCYGHGHFPDVVTGLEYERILSASGPTLGRLLRPSDNKAPRRIAWIQCAGSRTVNPPGLPYCSSVCCMYALKEAIVTKERFQNEIETVVFYMDMRTFGKDYEQYLTRARDHYDVRFKRSRPHSVEESLREDGSKGLTLTYSIAEAPDIQQEDFDMVVLSTGFCIPRDVSEMASTLGIAVNEHLFAKTTSFKPVSTSRPGIYVCGLFESPKDIPETMVQASAAASVAQKDLAPAAVRESQEDPFPPERDVTGETPRIGVFVCDCGQNIGGVIQTRELAGYAAGLPHVVLAEDIGHGCSRTSLVEIEKAVREARLNRVVVAACSPRTHETLFQDTLRRAGLNPYLMEMANIRDQDTWVHADNPVAARNKAKDLIRMAVSTVALSRPLAEHVIPMNKDILVLGGGVAGMTAAVSLADDGHKVFLVERSDRLGGVAAHITRTLEGEDVQAYLRGLVERTTQHRNIEVLTRALVVDHSGIPGLFKTGVQVGPRMQYRSLNHGVTILATGALPNRPKQYLFGSHEAVTTQLDLDLLLEEAPERVKDWGQVVMIQCVGSRTPENPNCSRVCCQSAIKNALRLKALNPNLQVSILYRDMRTYGFQEDFYRKARQQGVLFFRYEPEEAPEVSADGNKVKVVIKDPILGRKVQIVADCLTLSTGLVADEESTEELATLFHLPRTGDAYFLEDHVKLRPVDLPVPGFFVAGTAHAPKTIRESVTQALAAAGRAQTLLAGNVISLGASIAKVDGKKCAACLICVRACPFGIPFINADGYSEIDPARCHGCGVCAAECPAKAIQLLCYEDDQIGAKLEGLFEGEGPWKHSSL